MSRRARTSLKWALGLLIGALFIWLGAADWPLDRLLEGGVSLSGSTLRTATWSFDLVYLLPYVGVLVAIHYLRVLRWAPLLRPIAEVDFKRLNRVSAVGFMYLFVLPLRLGELARPYLIADRGDIKMSQALATIVVERVVDGLIVALALFCVLFFLPGHGGAGFAEIQVAAWIALAVFGGALVVLFAAAVRREWTTRTLLRLIGLVSKGLARKVVDVLESFLDGLAVLPNARYFLGFVAWSLVYWGLNGYGYYVLALGFAGLHVPLLGAYAMMCCVVVGMMLPNPPANVGVYWYFLLKPLALYGVATGDASATAFALLAWLGQLLQQGAFGLWFSVRGAREETRSALAAMRATTAPDGAE